MTYRRWYQVDVRYNIIEVSIYYDTTLIFYSKMFWIIFWSTNIIKYQHFNANISDCNNEFLFGNFILHFCEFHDHLFIILYRKKTPQDSSMFPNVFLHFHQIKVGYIRSQNSKCLTKNINWALSCFFLDIFICRWFFNFLII